MLKNFYVYGINPCTELLNVPNVVVKECYIEKNFKNYNVLDQLDQLNVKFQKLQRYELNNLIKHDKHQGIIIKIENNRNIELDEMINKISENKNPLILILDQIQDPQNLGSIFRSAHQFGVDGIIMLDRRQVGITPTVIKASAGSFFHIDYSTVNNLSNAIKKLKENKFWVYSTSIDDNSKDIKTLKFDTPTAIVIGNEGKGVSNIIIKNSDENIKILTFGKIDSLNVSVSTGIILYQIRNSQNW